MGERLRRQRRLPRRSWCRLREGRPIGDWLFIRGAGASPARNIRGRGRPRHGGRKIAGGGACATEGKGEIAASRLALLAMTGLGAPAPRGRKASPSARGPRKNGGLRIADWELKGKPKNRRRGLKIFTVVGAVSDRDLAPGGSPAVFVGWLRQEDEVLLK